MQLDVLLVESGTSAVFSRGGAVVAALNLGGDGALVLGAAVVLLLAVAFGLGIAISNWRAGRSIRDARKRANLVDDHARRRPQNEEFVSSTRMRRTIPLRTAPPQTNDS